MDNQKHLLVKITYRFTQKSKIRNLKSHYNGKNNRRLP